MKPQSAYYPLARPIAWRFVGTAFVTAAMALIISAVVLAANHGSGKTLAFIGIGLAVLIIVVWYVFVLRAYVLRADDEGFRVHLVRGAGTKHARWAEVESAAATYVKGLPCLVLTLSGDRSTTIPVGLLNVDREQFVRDVQRHLRQAQATDFVEMLEHDHAGHDHD